MNLTFQVGLITEGKEKRISENCFCVEKEGYVVYPLDQLIEIKRTENTTSVAQGSIIEIQWKNSQTVIFYELKSLNSVN